ncbi:xanthine dehydrogenase family protein molybdopterin-binding subunit [Chelatococcus reniformis]|uniref:Aldehyde dehydrogenase n=1 Tax=Chelatococcus reniformis TaxID=1494448 RepID=A0A916USJ1_9HYPH|nr:molybdopterin cofactor-binding domain-containing protein [Chelatococcus reniformis]GGC84634.1 aldehyde dehydrogenase [Chelatococcus reniformis]
MGKMDRWPERATLNRRAFLIGTGATGLLLGYSAMRTGPHEAKALGAGSFEPTVWYTIAPDGKVTVVCGKAEMGQHVSSAMAQIVADELEADWRKVAVVFPTNDPKFNDPLLGAQITGGSWSVRMNFDPMSRAGAAGRVTLVKAGAEIMGVPEAECFAQNSQVIHGKSGKRIGYGPIVGSGKADRTWTPDELKAIKLKPASQYKLIGQSVPQLDVPAKTDGTAAFGIDAAVPDMLYGKPVVPPVRYGATVKSVDDSAARKVPGFVKVVVLDDKTATITGWLVVVARSYPAAKAAAEALKVEWDKGPNAAVSDETIIREAKRLQLDPSAGQFFVKAGDPGAAVAGAAKVVEAEYFTSINIHAALEPMNALAEQKDGHWHIYTGNQFATRTGGIAAAALGVDPKTVVVHQHYLGGGFGRRLDADMVIPAVLAAKDVGKPVKVIYAREDDMQMDFTRPLTYQKVRAGLDGDGRLVGLEHDVVCAWPTARWGIPEFLTPSVDKKGALDSFVVNGADFWYTVPNHQVRAVLNEVAQRATPSGQLRSVAPGWTFWAVESLIDELAAAAGKDPVDFRLALLDGAGANAVGAKRLANALRTAVGRSGYGALALPKGQGIGVACVSSQERATATWTACAAQVDVEPDSGAFKVNRLTIAMDVGTAVNPDGVRAQIEGSVLWGLSLALYEHATLEGGALQVANFDSYTPLRMSQVPDIDISIIANGEPPSGCGEPGVTVVAPAIANAIFRAAGARVRSLPITPETVKAAIKA